MTEKCKTCHKEFNSGIWMSGQFINEKVLLFCSDKCKKRYIKKKLNRIKVGYPKYYEKLIKQPQKKEGFYDFEIKNTENKGDKIKENKVLGKKKKYSVAGHKGLIGGEE